MLPSPKELKKLADTCRKAGIKHFKSTEFEFTLTDDMPVKPGKRPSTPIDNKPFQSDSLTEEELLFWSVGAGESA